MGTLDAQGVEQASRVLGGVGERVAALDLFGQPVPAPGQDVMAGDDDNRNGILLTDSGDWLRCVRSSFRYQDGGLWTE